MKCHSVKQGSGGPVEDAFLPWAEWAQFYRPREENKLSDEVGHTDMKQMRMTTGFLSRSNCPEPHPLMWLWAVFVGEVASDLGFHQGGGRNPYK